MSGRAHKSRLKKWLGQDPKPRTHITGVLHLISFLKIFTLVSQVKVKV